MDVTMPQLGETVTEGTITSWFKKVGEAVALDEPLFEVSTDKVDSEVPAPGSGVLTEILVAEGDTVVVGTRLAVIGEAGAVPAVAPVENVAAQAVAEQAVEVAPAAPVVVAPIATPVVEPAASPRCQTESPLAVSLL